MLQRAQVVAQRLAHAAVPHDQHIARLIPQLEAPLAQLAPHRAPHHHHGHGKQQGQRHRNARYRRRPHHIERPAQQHARGKRRLYGQALLIQAAAALRRTVQPVHPREDHHVQAEQQQIAHRDRRKFVQQPRQHTRGRRRRRQAYVEGDQPGRNRAQKIQRRPDRHRRPRAHKQTRMPRRCPAVPVPVTMQYHLLEVIGDCHAT